MSENFLSVASETEDLVQFIGVGIKGFWGSMGLELAPFFPFFVLASLGTRCMSFFPMAELEELQ